MQYGQDTNRLQAHLYIVNSSIAQISQGLDGRNQHNAEKHQACERKLCREHRFKETHKEKEIWNKKEKERMKEEKQKKKKKKMDK